VEHCRKPFCSKIIQEIHDILNFYCHVCSILWLLCIFCSVYSVYGLCVNVSCTAATGCQPNCSYIYIYKLNAAIFGLPYKMSSPVLSAGLCEWGCTFLKLAPPLLNFITVTGSLNSATLHSMENAIGGACSSDGGRERRVQGFGGEIWREETTGESWA
jgi:hypothetical protein